ncbi:hypothetical protein AB6D20_027870 (plasmid) [Vibrio splendidus]
MRRGGGVAVVVQSVAQSVGSVLHERITRIVPRAIVPRALVVNLDWWLTWYFQQYFQQSSVVERGEHAVNEHAVNAACTCGVYLAPLHRFGTRAPLHRFGTRLDTT